MSCQGPQFISTTPPAMKAFCHVFVVARRESGGGDTEGTNTHAVPLGDPISEKDNGRITQSDLDTLNDYSLRTRGPTTRDYRFLNA